MKLAVIIVTYKNSIDDTEMVIKSLLIYGIKKNDIFISDNTKENLGYGGGINRILKKILNKYEYFFIINPDIILHNNCINLLLDKVIHNPQVGIVGPKILDEEGRIWSLGGEIDSKRYSGGLIGYRKENKESKNTTCTPDFVSGTAMLIKKEVFKKIGIFSEDYFLYYEDVDFCLRAKNAGFQLAINPKAEIVHYASSTVGKNSPAQQYYMARNHMLFVERFGPLSVKLHEIMRLPKTWKQATKYERLGMRDYFVRRFGKRDYWS